MTTAKTMNNNTNILSFVFKYLHFYIFITLYTQFPSKSRRIMCMINNYFDYNNANEVTII